LYFAADDRAWWIGEIRTYDGGPGNGAEWASFPPGPYARSPIGTAWVGDLDVLGAGRVGPVRLHLGGVALRVGPKEGYAARADGGIPLPPGSTPFSSDGPLHCSGILETTPADAHSTLLELGYRVSWRVAVGTWAEWRTQVLPPAGVIAAYTPVVGIDGAIVIAVVPVDHPDASVVPRPADCPAPS
jgi:hypothetical protein